MANDAGYGGTITVGPLWKAFVQRWTLKDRHDTFDGTVMGAAAVPAYIVGLPAWEVRCEFVVDNAVDFTNTTAATYTAVGGDLSEVNLTATEKGGAAAVYKGAAYIAQIEYTRDVAQGTKGVATLRGTGVLTRPANT